MNIDMVHCKFQGLSNKDIIQPFKTVFAHSADPDEVLSHYFISIEGGLNPISANFYVPLKLSKCLLDENKQR